MNAKDANELLQEKFPWKLRETENFVYHGSETEEIIGDVMGLCLLRYVGRDAYEIQNPDAVWDYFTDYYYFKTEEDLILFKMRFL